MVFQLYLSAIQFYLTYLLWLGNNIGTINYIRTRHSSSLDYFTEQKYIKQDISIKNYYQLI